MPLSGLLTISPSEDEWIDLKEIWINYKWSDYFAKYWFVIEDENHIHIAFEAKSHMSENTDTFRRQLITNNKNMPRIEYMKQYKLSYSAEKTPLLGGIAYCYKYFFIDKQIHKAKPYIVEVIHEHAPQSSFNDNPDFFRWAEYHAAEEVKGNKTKKTDILSLPDYGRHCLNQPDFISWELDISRPAVTAALIYDKMGETKFTCLSNPTSLTCYILQLQLKLKHLPQTEPETPTNTPPIVG